jgi:hypothetical protein
MFIRLDGLSVAPISVLEMRVGLLTEALNPNGLLALVRHPEGMPEQAALFR